MDLHKHTNRRYAALRRDADVFPRRFNSHGGKIKCQKYNNLDK